MHASFALLALVASAVNAAPANPLSQISDGQVQAPTGSASASMPASSVKPSPSSTPSPSASKMVSTASAVSQISDGQIQAPPSTAVVSHPAPAPTTVTKAVPSTSVVVSQPAPSVETLYSTDVTTVTSCSTSSSAVQTHPASAPTASSTKVVTQSASAPSSTPSSKCPFDLPGDFQFPHAIVTNGVNDYSAHISSSVSTAFTFDIPTSYSGKTCTLVFALPAHGTMETSEYTLSGSGSIEFSSSGTHLGSFTPTENSVFKTSGPCPAGKSVTVDVKGSGSVDLSFFEDYNPCPLGAYIVPS